MNLKFEDREGDIEIDDLTFEGLNEAKNILLDTLNEIEEKLNKYDEDIE